MRREKSRETLQSGALARVRMFLKADLGWLPGFPLGVHGRGVDWVVVPREDGRMPERTTIDREHLQRSVYTYNRLAFRFPHALPRAVEDIDAWKHGVPFLIALLKPGVQTRRPVPTSIFSLPGTYSLRTARAAAELVDRHPCLGRFLNALGYILVLTPDDLAPALQWADRHAAELGNSLTVRDGDKGLISLVAWWELCRRARYRDAEFLISIIGDARATTLPTHGWAPLLNGLRQAIVDSASKRSRAKLPAMPRPVLTDALDAFALDGLQLADVARKRALKLLSIVLDVDLLGLWETAWRRLEETPGARQHILRGLGPAAVQLEVQRVEARIQALLREHPPEVHIATVLADIRKLSMSGHEPSYQAVCRALMALPPVHEGVLARAAFLHDWAGWLPGSPPPDPLFDTVVRRLASYLAAKGRTAALLRPWANILKAWDEGPTSPWSVLRQILDDDPDASAVEMSFRALEKAVVEKPLGTDYEQACVLVDLAKTLKDPDLALECADRLAAADVKGPYLDIDLIRTTLALDPGGEDFGRLYKNLRDVDTGRSERESVVKLERDLREGGWSGIVAKAITSGDGESVMALSARRRALMSLGGKGVPPARIPADRAPEWIGLYPPEFAAALTDLSVLGAKAERTARRVLGQDFIPTTALRTEIDALESKLRGLRKSTPLARRLANLRARLADAQTLATTKSGRLGLRLDRAVPKAVFKTWNERLDGEFNSRLIETLGVTSIPDEFTGQIFWLILASILNLSRPFREIGLELLSRRCGPPPWNLFGHPANAAFLDRIFREGVDAAPWVEPAVAHEVRSQNGRALRVAFADDPLEIFRMGAYFQTCLSPGGINFYSTVSNAADVNKRVLFARDGAGRVTGRCLFALTDRGAILTFHPYCHDKGLGFEQIVSRFAAELASRMKTAVVTKGRVERLVAPRWYDDGPRDTGFRFPCLEEGSVFRSQLEKIGLDDLLAAAAAAVAPLALNALTLPPIVMLPEVEDRPELVLPLLTRLEQSEDVPAEVWARAVNLARQAGRPDEARRIYDKRLVPFLSKQIRNDNLDKEIIELGLDVNPSGLLRVFRQTRPRGCGIRSDEEEPSYRREWIARAHERLGRGHLASRLRPRD